MNDIVNDLRTIAYGCDRTSIDHPQHDTILAAANLIEHLRKHLANARNEICYNCGKYRQAHNGACDGCKWRDKE